MGKLKVDSRLKSCSSTMQQNMQWLLRSLGFSEGITSHWPSSYTQEMKPNLWTHILVLSLYVFSSFGFCFCVQSLDYWAFIWYISKRWVWFLSYVASSPWTGWCLHTGWENLEWYPFCRCACCPWLYKQTSTCRQFA